MEVGIQIPLAQFGAGSVRGWKQRECGGGFMEFKGGIILNIPGKSGWEAPGVVRSLFFQDQHNLNSDLQLPPLPKPQRSSLAHSVQHFILSTS